MVTRKELQVPQLVPKEAVSRHSGAELIQISQPKDEHLLTRNCLQALSCELVLVRTSFGKRKPVRTTSITLIQVVREMLSVFASEVG